MKNLIIGFILMLFLSSCQNKKQELIIFHAGSLSIPFKAIEAEFEKQNPNIDIKREAAGSRICARKISDLNRDCDIMASADYKVIENLLFPDFAEFCITFASNELVIAYTERSEFSDSINSENWYKILEQYEVHFGRTDPNADPCGYRTLLSFQLANKIYKNLNLEKLNNKDLEFIRPTEADISSLLNIGELDYAFLYKSVAKQHKLKFIELNDSINLSNKNLDRFYSQAKIQLDGKKPGELITQTASPIVYGLTIPKNSQNPEAAKDFIKFLNSEKGEELMNENYHQTLEFEFTESSTNKPTDIL